MVPQAGAFFDTGAPCAAEANLDEMLAADASWEAAAHCFQAHGDFSFVDQYDAERNVRETRLYDVAPISTNLIRDGLAEHVLCLPRLY